VWPIFLPGVRVTPVPKCKSCGKAITPEAAAASIFDLSFPPLKGRPITRRTAKAHAKHVGPLCPKCLGRRKDLGSSPGSWPGYRGRDGRIMLPQRRDPIQWSAIPLRPAPGGADRREPGNLDVHFGDHIAPRRDALNCTARKALRAAWLESLTMHDGRHTFIRHYLARGRFGQRQRIVRNEISPNPSLDISDALS
jgi:hypothetical protein